MSNPQSEDLQPPADALIAIRNAVERWLRCPQPSSGTRPEVVAAMLDTADATSEITIRLLQESVPGADDDEPGTGEALERATDLAVDARRHLVTALNLMVGANAIVSKVAGPR